MAEVLFATPATPDRAKIESDAVQRFARWLDRTSDKKQVRVVADFVDSDLMKYLSGANQLALARLIEQHSPEVIPLLTNIGALRRHLEQVEELAAVFSPETIDKMIQAILAEDQVGRHGGANE